MKHKFISYSWKDVEFVTILANALENAGIRIFRDINGIIPGSVINEKIDEALQSSNVFILVASVSSLSSDWVLYEARKAFDLEKQGRLSVVVIKYQNCDIDKYLPEYAGRHYIQWNGNIASIVQELSKVIQPNIAPQFGVHRVVEFKGLGGMADYTFNQDSPVPSYKLHLTLLKNDSYCGVFWEPVSAIFIKDFKFLKWEIRSDKTGHEYQMKIEMEHDEQKVLLPIKTANQWQECCINFENLLTKELNILERVTIAMDGSNRNPKYNEYFLSIRSISLA